MAQNAPDESPRLLHLGCGLVAPTEWVNVDGSSNAWLAQHPVLKSIVRALRIFPASQLDIPWPKNIRIANLTKRLPFPDQSFDAVYSSHTVEHLHRSQALHLLKEIHRVLRVGGRCRTLVPDLESLVNEYLGKGAVAAPDVRYPGDPARQLVEKMLMRSATPAPDSFMRRLLLGPTDLHSHKWMYDGASIINLMNEAGFTDCRRRGFLESEIPHLDRVEQSGRVLNGTGVAVEGARSA